MQKQGCINFTDGETKALNNKEAHQDHIVVNTGMYVGLVQL